MNWLSVVLIFVLLVGAVWGLLRRSFVSTLAIFVGCFFSLALAAFLVDILVDTPKAAIMMLVLFFVGPTLILYSTGVLTSVEEKIEWEPPEWVDFYGGALAGAGIAAIISAFCIVVTLLFAVGIAPVSLETTVDIALPIAMSVLARNMVYFFGWLTGTPGLVISIILGAGLAALAIKRPIKIGSEAGYDSELMLSRSKVTPSSGFVQQRAVWPRFGVEAVNLPLGLIREYNLPRQRGVLVEEAYEGEPADKAGLKKDDLIINIGEDVIDSVLGLQEAIRKHEAGEAVEVAFIRDNQLQTVKVVLEANV